MDSEGLLRGRLLVCRTCGGLRDPLTVDAELRQLCSCADRGSQPRWDRYDFNLRHELCRLCGASARWSGSRWCTWFCKPCMAAVASVNNRLGYVIPIGRHSVHAGSWVQLSAPAAVRERQAEALFIVTRGAGERMDLLEEWRLMQVRRIWTAAGFALHEEVTLPGFEVAALAVAKAPRNLVAGLLEHLARPA